MLRILSLIGRGYRARFGRTGAFAPAILASIVAVVVLVLANHMRMEQLRTQERAAVASQLASISSRLQTNVNGDAKLLQGLVAGIVVQPAMDQAAFSALSAQVLQTDSQLRSVAAAPGMVVKWVYPEKGNEKAIGLDYRTSETQRVGAMAARNTHNLVLVGPVELVQGGTAFIIRCPVYVNDGNSQAFWGLLSGVIDIQKLYADSGLDTTDLDLAVSTVPKPQSQHEVFFGDIQSFARDPVQASLDMAYGQWTLVALPKNGWGSKDSMLLFRICAALLSLCVVGPMVWAGILAQSRQKTISKLRKRESDLIFARRSLEHQSLHDPLTTLPNRRFIDRLLSQSQDSVSGERLALIHIDLDGFKEVNDTKGHATGDDVLRIAASRLRKTIGPNDIAARIGGDEFVVACRSAHPQIEATRLAHEIVDALSTPFLIDGNECRLGASAGVAWQNEQADASQLLGESDLALYEAKRTGRGRAQVFSEELRTAALQSKALADDFTLALDRDELVAFFQPQFDANTLELAGVEALARWNHPEKGILTPDKFLDVAENIGRSGAMDKAILHKALFEMTRWESLGLKVPRISVNISARRLADPELLAELAALPLQKGRLCFELLETISFDGQDASLSDVIGQISALGIDVEIDDFGTGHASILSLLRLQPSRLKIDRQFVIPMLTSQAQRRLVSSIIEIGRSQNIEIVAEGVETMEHAKILRDLGCQFLQGYAFARPMSSADLIDFCRSKPGFAVSPVSPRRKAS